VSRRTRLPQDLRTHHRSLVLRLLDDEGPMTRAEVARRTGLSVPTATSIVTALVTEGCLWEAGRHEATARRGPRASTVALARSSRTAIGVWLDVDRARVGLCDLSATVGETVEVPIDPEEGPDAALDRAITAAAPLAAAAGSTLTGIGVAVPGPVDPARQRCLQALRLGWRDVPVADRFERRLGAPTLVEYNVRAMALAEVRHGLGHPSEDLLYLHLGSGVGVALVVDGESLPQTARGASELAHHQLVADGPSCACGGVGCLEALVRHDRLAASAAAVSQTLERAMETPEAPLDVLVAAAQVDPGAEAVLDEFVGHLSSGLAVAVNLFSPSRVALGGFLTHAPKEVIDGIRRSARAKICAPLREGVRIERSELGEEAGVLAAATVALEELFFHAGHDG
jgi:predicted NBD/HSP70 family sugar kinase